MLPEQPIREGCERAAKQEKITDQSFQIFSSDSIRMLCGLELQRQKSYYSVIKTSRTTPSTVPAQAVSEESDKLPVVELRPFVSCVWERGKSYSNGFPEISSTPPITSSQSAPQPVPMKRTEPEADRLHIPQVGLVTDLVIGSSTDSSPVRFETPRIRRTFTHAGPSWFTPENVMDNRHLGVMGRRLPWGSSSSTSDLKALYSRGNANGSCVKKSAIDTPAPSRNGPRMPPMQPLPVHRVNLLADSNNVNRNRRFDAVIKRKWPHLHSSFELKTCYGLKSETRGEMSLRRGKLANRKHYGQWLPKEGPQESLEGAMLTFGNADDEDNNLGGAG